MDNGRLPMAVPSLSPLVGPHHTHSPAHPPPVHHTLWSRVCRVCVLVRCRSPPPPRITRYGSEFRIGRVSLPCRFGVSSSPPPCITRYGLGGRIDLAYSPNSLRCRRSPSPVHHTLWIRVSASAVRAHPSVIFMRPILVSRFLMIVSRLAGTSASIKLRTDFDDLVLLHAEKS